MSNVQVIEQIKKVENGVMKQVDTMVSQGISFPANYDPKKAVVNAISIIKQDSKLMNCNPASIAQSISYMVQLGLEPSAKQCYFIPYGQELKLSPSYFGTQTILRRINGVIDIVAQVIYNDDEVDYEIENGHIVNFIHKTNFKNRKSGIAGAYAIIALDEEIFGRTQHIEIMDEEEIKLAWGQGATKGNSPAHKNFPQEMSKKTVINRASKNFVNTLTDSDNVDLVSAYNATISEETQKVEAEFEEKPQEQIEAFNEEVQETEIIDGVEDHENAPTEPKSIF